jgi:hypothetical protein
MNNPSHAGNPLATFSPSQLKLGEQSALMRSRRRLASLAPTFAMASQAAWISGEIAVRPEKSLGSTAASLRIEDDRDLVPVAASLIEVRRLHA